MSTVDPTSGEHSTPPLAAPEDAIFISFSLRDEDQVRRFADKLKKDLKKRESTLEVVVSFEYSADQPPDWPSWQVDYIQKAKCVLVASTEAYRLSWEAADHESGAGVRSEVMLIDECINRAPKQRRRFIPIQFGPLRKEDIRVCLASDDCCDLTSDDGYYKLLARLGAISTRERVALAGAGVLERFRRIERKLFSGDGPLATTVRFVLLIGFLVLALGVFGLLRDADSQARDLRRNIDKTQATLASYESELDGIAQRLQQSLKALDNATEQFKQTNDQIAAATGELKTQTQNLQEQQGSMGAQIAETIRLAGYLKTEREELKSTGSHLNLVAHTLDDSDQGIREAGVALAKTSGELRGNVDDMAAGFRTALAGFKDLKGDFDSTHGDYKQTEGQLTQAKTVLSKDIDWILATLEEGALPANASERIRAVNLYLMAVAALGTQDVATSVASLAGNSAGSSVLPVARARTDSRFESQTQVHGDGYAMAMLNEAIRLHPHDARYFYVRAIAHLRNNDKALAERDAERGGELERKGHPNSRTISESLMRFQGEQRAWLEVYRRHGGGSQPRKPAQQVANASSGHVSHAATISRHKSARPAAR